MASIDYWFVKRLAFRLSRLRFLRGEISYFSMVLILLCERSKTAKFSNCFKPKKWVIRLLDKFSVTNVLERTSRFSIFCITLLFRNKVFTPFVYLTRISSDSFSPDWLVVSEFMHCYRFYILAKLQYWSWRLSFR